MSELSRRPSRRPTRRERETRAYRLTLATGVSAVATAVSIVLWIAGATSFGLVLLLVLITSGLGYGLKRSVGR